VLAQAALPSRPPAGPAALGHYRPELALRLHPGPHHEVRAFAALQTRTFVVSERSRMGVRLEFSGRAAEADTEASILSTGMPLGAVQLPPDGRPLVLLADRGRTGGYPVVGVVDRADLAALAQARPATKVRFLVPGEHASF
jgi:allophanate hydrolase subunit 2